MTKKTKNRLVKDKKISPPMPAPAKEKRNFQPAEMMELQEMVRLVNAERFKALMIKGNTALVTDGQKVAQQCEEVARLLENAKNQWVSLKLLECGYEADAKCNINLTTGEITSIEAPAK